MISMGETIIKVEHISKEYRLGTIGGGTLKGDLQSVWARLRGKEDPNGKIGTAAHSGNDRFLALDDISFEVRKGEALGIIGHNGAGKSTLLKLLSRVTAPTSGTICYNGRIASMLEVGTGFHPELTGRENVYLNGAILGMTKAEIDRKFDQIVEFAEMEKFIDTPVKRYSSGMYVKLAFAVAAHLDSEIMVMDEVLAVGDMKFQQKCLGKMGDAANHEGRTVLYVSHNMNTIRQLCTRCIVLDHGKVIYDGNVEEAINLYLQRSDTSRVLSMDLSKENRPNWLVRHNIKLLNASFLNKNFASFVDNEPVDLRLCWQNKSDISNLCLRIEICRLDMTPVASALIHNFYTGKKDALASCDVSLDLSQLMEGTYRMVFAPFIKNQYGKKSDVDHVDGLIFTKMQGASSKNILWQPRDWGDIQLPNIKLRKGFKNEGSFCNEYNSEDKTLAT